MATEKRLIDANALFEMGRARKIIEVVDNWNELPGCAKSACVRLAIAHKKMILDAPTVDAVEVVRCKDCKWFSRDSEYNRAWCNYFYGALETAVNGYCYHGAKMDGDGNE